LNWVVGRAVVLELDGSIHTACVGLALVDE
jgi:hypothetical protein